MSCDTPLVLRVKEKVWNPVEEIWEDSVRVPCGKCYNCRMNRVQQWTFRLMQELKVSTSAYFVTLTYDNATVPIDGKGRMTLLKNTDQDLNLPDRKKMKVQIEDRTVPGFMKRLRYYEEKDIKNGIISFDRYKKIKTRGQIAAINKPIKMFAAAEYGSKRKRPHFHLILFNVNDQRNIVNAWKLGGVHIAECNEATIMYTLKYMMKDQDDRPKGVQKEFHLMSKGLGKNFITFDTIKNQSLDYINYVTTKQGFKIPTPRYYSNKMFTEYEEKDGKIRPKNVQEKKKIIKERKAKFVASEIKKRQDEDERLAAKEGVNLEEFKAKKKAANVNRLKNPLKNRDYD